MGRRARDDSRQQRVNFERGSELAALRDCILPPLRDKHGDPVSMTTAKLVLSIIDSHAGGREAWVSFATLAAKVGKGVRTIKRAVEALEASSLIVATYKRSPCGKACNHYRIVWNELALLRPAKASPDLGESAIFAEKSAIPAEKCATTGTQSVNSKRQEESARVRNERNELRKFPDFSALQLSSPYDVELAHGLLDGAYAIDRVALAAAVAVRKGKKPSALFVKILREGPGKYQPSEVDHATAKQTLRTLNGLGRELRAPQPAYSAEDEA